MSILHITNGDSALAPLHRAGFRGTFLPWRDVLHEGPVPAGSSLEELSAVRARFLAGRGWRGEAEIRRELTDRDQLLLAAGRFPEIFLWFEDDLYDQLQILQILSSLPADRPPAWLVEIEGSLGAATTEVLQQAYSRRREIEPSLLDVARLSWTAFRAPTPEPWAGLLERDLSLLPHLRSAVLRWLEELPDPRAGLPRVERRALEILARNPETAGRLFSRYGASEERPFLGDTVFYDRLQALLAPSQPLLRFTGTEPSETPFAERQLTPTPTGLAVLSGERRWTDLQPVDRWFGGTHLQTGSVWLWDPEKQELRHD